MKKFTVISLLLVLVAGFAFAGLAPYSTAGYGIYGYGSLEDKLEALVVDGYFVAGVVANDLVDINFEIETELNRGYLIEFDEFDVDPSLNVTYAGEKLTAGASFALPLVYKAEDVLKIDNVDPKYYFDVDAFASYTNALKDGKHILTVTGDADFVFAGNLMDAALFASANVTDGNLSATARGFFDFGAEGGLLALEFVKGADISANYTYKDVKFSGSANIANFNVATYDLYGGAYAPYNFLFDVDEDEVTDFDAYKITAAGSAVYSWKKAAGSLKLDAYSVDATAKLETAGFKGGAFTTKATAKVVVGLPHLLPVELIPNMALNLPTTFTASAVYNNTKKNVTYSFNAKAHIAYFEFAKKVSVFDETIDSLDVTFSYGNTCAYDLDFAPVSGTKSHNIAANVTLKLSKGAVVFTFANDTADVTHLEPKNDITLSYTKTY